MRLPFRVMCMFGWAITDQRLVELGCEPPAGWIYHPDVSVWTTPNVKEV
jgi:hypothetical protein